MVIVRRTPLFTDIASAKNSLGKGFTHNSITKALRTAAKNRIGALLGIVLFGQSLDGIYDELYYLKKIYNGEIYTKKGT